MGGVLVAAVGAGWAIAVDAVTFAVSAACLAMLRVPVRVAAQRSSFLADLRQGWIAFRSRRWVWTFVLYFASINLLWGAWGTLGPVVAERDLGGAAAWDAILAVMGVGGLAGSLFAAHVNPTLQRHIPGESLSWVSSYDWLGSLAFYPLGLAIWGPVAAVIGVSVSLWLAFGLAVALTLALLTVPDIRHLPAVAQPVPAPTPSPAGSPTP